MSTPTISVTIITFNEESNIRRCLESIKWADEIIVVDSGSTDGTTRICEEYNCLVFSHVWEGYARQKNYALKQATCDWVFSLDADEEVTPVLGDEIRKTIGLAKADAYTLPRKNQFLGKWMEHGGWYPDRQLRLFKRGCGNFKIVPLHEYFELKEQTQVGKLSNPLMHYTYPTVSDFIARAELYTNIEAAARIKEGRRPKSLMLSLVFAVPIKFAEVYLYKGGWMDGLHGLVAATLTSMRVFLRYVKMWQAVCRHGDTETR